MAPNGCAPVKWKLLQAVEDAREPLGLRSTSIVVLRAMLSFVRADRLSAARDDEHICFASNASLARRCHVSVATVERHVARLVSLGLLSRRRSGNGKRWARRDRQGNVTMATGLSLLPLAQRHAEFLRLGQAREDLRRELSLLRDKCALALARLKAVTTNIDGLSCLVVKARTLLRRKPAKDALEHLLSEISVEISRSDPSQTENLPGNDHETEGHKETRWNPVVEKEESLQIRVTNHEMEQAFPRLCAELRFARHPTECTRIMDDISRQMHLGETAYLMKKLGPALNFMLLGYLLERIESVKNPRRYMQSLINAYQGKRLAWQTLLATPKPAARAGVCHHASTTPV